MPTSVEPPRQGHLCQIAMSVLDLRRTHQWYVDVLGFEPAGGTRLFRGPLAERVQGVAGAASTCWWLVDRQHFFQLELFEFRRPKPRPPRPDWRPCDIGYTMIGVHVSDFDATCRRAAAHGSPPLTDPEGEPGRRRVCVRDPEGLLVELMEDDPRAPTESARPFHRVGSAVRIGSAVRFVTVSVPDLEAARATFVDGFGLQPAETVELHGSRHERLWGLAGARRRALALWADGLVVELVEYLEPRGRPRPSDYSISDQGLLNIAFGFRTRRDLDRTLARAMRTGAKPNWRVLDVGCWGVVYVDDAHGFSIELLYVRPWWDRRMGFVERAADLVVERSVSIDVPTPTVWRRIADHASMHEWWPDASFELAVEGEDGGGPGTVRLVRSGRRVLDEQVVGWEPGRRLDYRLRAGAPLLYHFGRVELQETPARGPSSQPSSTALTWRIRFCPLIPGTGWVLRLVIDRMLRRALSNLKALLEARPLESARGAT